MRLTRVMDTFACDSLPCRMCHASNLLPLDEHTVLVAFFGGSYEGEKDTAVYLSRLVDGRCVQLDKIAASAEAHWNPVLFSYLDGHVGIIFKVGNVIATWRSYLMESFDKGLSFTAPKELVAGDLGGRGPVRNKPLRLKSGRILCPASLEEGMWRAFVDISDDDMKTLRKGPEIFCPQQELEKADSSVKADIKVSEQSFSGRGVIQPALFEDASGVHMLLRSTIGFVMRSDSTDDGESWCEPYKVEMPNNNSGLDADMYQDRLYLVCNPVEGNWGLRSPITLFSSSDGYHFHQEEILDSEKAEFSYPCVRVYGDFLYICYTYKRTNIRVLKYKFVR